jgi:glutamate-1-semialdehyde 2,1-aminomutase
MSAMDSTLRTALADKAKEITKRELATYAERTASSQRANARARKVLPLGVPSSFQAYDPYPLVVRSAHGPNMTDVDGNVYTDYDMGFGALFAGHQNPLVRAAIDTQLGEGTLFVTPCESNADVAEMLVARYGLPMWRFTNSGTEATMDAIRVARAATGRDKIVKVEGGYHGHHDEVMISMKPSLDVAGPADAPFSVPASAGISKKVLSDTIVIPYNDARALERVLKSGEVACFIVEPIMENIGICLPDEGYLQEVREITQHYGTLLGTYNGNPLCMAAAKAVLSQVCTPEVTAEVIARNGLLVNAVSEIIHDASLPAHVVQFGAKGCVTWAEKQIRNYRDYKASDFDLAFAQWIHGINRGVLLPPGLDEQWLISVMHTDADALHYADVFESFVQELTK